MYVRYLRPNHTCSAKRTDRHLAYRRRTHIFMLLNHRFFVSLYISFQHVGACALTSVLCALLLLSLSFCFGRLFVCLIWSWFASPAQAEDDVQLELSEDGILSVVSGDKKLWSSTLTPLGKRLPDFRYVQVRVEVCTDSSSGRRASRFCPRFLFFSRLLPFRLTFSGCVPV